MIKIIALSVYIVGWIVSTIFFTLIQKGSNIDTTAGNVMLNALIALLWPVTVPVILLLLANPIL